MQPARWVYQVWQWTMSTDASLPLMTRSCSIVAKSFACRGSSDGSVTGGCTPSTRSVPVLPALFAETEDVDGMTAVVEGGELARKVFDVDAGAAVHVRRIFVGEDANPHRVGPLPCRSLSIISVAPAKAPS